MNSVINKFLKFKKETNRKHFFSFDLNSVFNQDELEIIKIHYSQNKDIACLIIVGDCPNCGSDIASNYETFNEKYFKCSHCRSHFYGSECENNYWTIDFY